MKRLADLAVRRAWWVIGAWVLAIVVVQFAASGAGGATYKDEFKLPGTETQVVSDLLANSGLDNQNGIDGNVVLHASAAPRHPPPGRCRRRPRGPVPRRPVTGIASGWGSIDCAQGGRLNPAGANPRLIGSRDSASRSPTSASPVAAASTRRRSTGSSPARTLRSSTLQVEFTGGAFLAVQHASGIPPEIFGFLAALVILAVVFRTVGAVALPLLSAAAALGSGLGADLAAQPRHGRRHLRAATRPADGHRRRRRLRAVHRHPAPAQPAARHGGARTRSRSRSTPPAGPCCSPARPSASRCSGSCALGVSFLYGVARGTSIAVALTMIASLTLLPGRAVACSGSPGAAAQGCARDVIAGTYVDAAPADPVGALVARSSRSRGVCSALAAGIIVAAGHPVLLDAARPRRRVERPGRARPPARATT